MAIFCITISNPEFQKLLAESGQKQGVFAMMVSKWMTENEIYDRYPTLQELGISPITSVKPGIAKLFESKRSFADYSDFGKTLSEQEIINLKKEGNKVTAKQFLESIIPVNDFEKKLKSFLLSIDLNKLNSFDFVINDKYQGNIIGLNERELFEKPTVIFNSKSTTEPSRYKLHEFLHSLLDTVINEEQEFRTELITLFDYVKTLPEFKNEYGVIGWWEFYTEGMTNPNFQAKLKNVTLSGYKGGKKSSVYEEFVKIINGILEKLGFVNKDYSALDEIINATTKVIEKRYGYSVKPGVSELFESNPELANAVYEALGFNQMITPNDKVVFGHPTIGKSFLKKQGEGRFITLDDDYKNEVNAFVDANRGSETRQEYKGRKPKEYNEFMLNLYDRLKVQAQREGKILFVSNTNILKERMSDFDKVITIPKAEFKRRFDERGATYGFEDWKSDIDATVAKVPTNKVISTSGYLADLFITPQQKQQALQLYSQYLDTTTNPTIEGFKSFVGNVGDTATDIGVDMSSDETRAFNSLVNDGTIPIKCE